MKYDSKLKSSTNKFFCHITAMVSVISRTPIQSRFRDGEQSFIVPLLLTPTILHSFESWFIRHGPESYWQWSLAGDLYFPIYLSVYLRCIKIRVKYESPYLTSTTISPSSFLPKTFTFHSHIKKIRTFFAWIKFIAV